MWNSRICLYDIPPERIRSGCHQLKLWSLIARIEKNTNRSAWNTKAELETKIKMVYKDLLIDTVRNACAEFQIRLKLTVILQP